MPEEISTSAGNPVDENGDFVPAKYRTLSKKKQALLDAYIDGLLQQ